MKIAIFWRKFRSKRKILCTPNLLSGIFPKVYRKIAIFCSVYFFNLRHRCFWFSRYFLSRASML